MQFEKPSSIKELKELTDSLISRDIELKQCLIIVKQIIEDKNLTNSEKVKLLNQKCLEYYDR